MLKVWGRVALVTMLLPTAVSAQSANAVLAAASQAMGVNTLNSITYSGTARTGSFLQSKAIGYPMGQANMTSVTAYTRTINFATPAAPTALVSRATGTTAPPVLPGLPTPTPGMLNQNITGMQLGASWAQALNVWTTPWGFIKAAMANNATVRQEGRQQVVTFSPAGLRSPSGQAYRVTGWLDTLNHVRRVETVVENTVVGDMLVEFDYSFYQDRNGVQVPGLITQKQAGLPVFDAVITAGAPNPPQLDSLLTPPAPAGGGGGGGGGGGAAQAPAAPPVTQLGPGAFKIGGNYASLAIDMGDHVLVVESGQSEARGLAVMAAARQAIPNKPIRFVVNSHPHSDHTSGVPLAVAAGATILTHVNNEPWLERFLTGPRTLLGDSLARVRNRRTDVVQAVGTRDVRRGTNGKVVELIHIPNDHSEGMLAVYLPAERVLWAADVTVVNPTPVQRAVVRSVVNALNPLNLTWDTFIPAHPPNPERTLTRADLMTAAGN